MQMPRFILLLFIAASIMTCVFCHCLKKNRMKKSSNSFQVGSNSELIVLRGLLIHQQSFHCCPWLIDGFCSGAVFKVPKYRFIEGSYWEEKSNFITFMLQVH